jgi:hypothetical protein
MTYTPEQENRLRSVCYILANGGSPELFSFYKEVLADEGIELKEPTEETQIEGIVGRKVSFSMEQVRQFDEEHFYEYVAREVAGSIIRTVRLADLLSANDLEPNTEE